MAKLRKRNSRKCGRITKAGNPCKRTPAGRSKFCISHKRGASKKCKKNPSRSSKKKIMRRKLRKNTNPEHFPITGQFRRHLFPLPEGGPRPLRVNLYVSCAGCGKTLISKAKDSHKEQKQGDEEFVAGRMIDRKTGYLRPYCWGCLGVSSSGVSGIARGGWSPPEDTSVSQQTAIKMMEEHHRNPVVPVYLASHGMGEPRMVRVPDDTPEEDLLNQTFYYGQNDFQPQPAPSVSVGDVIRLPDGSLHRVMFAGFKRLPDDYNPLTLTGRDAWRAGYGRRYNPVKRYTRKKRNYGPW